MSEQRERTWGKFPLWWCKALRGKATAMAVAAVISKHADIQTGKNAFPKLQTIADVVGVHPHRVSEAIGVLISAGIVSRKLTGRAPRYQVFYDSPNSGDSLNSGDSPKSGDSDSLDSSYPESPTSLGETRPSTGPITKPAAAARENDGDATLKAAWEKESPAKWKARGIRNFAAFVASQIRSGVMPEQGDGEDDFIRSLRAAYHDECGICGESKNGKRVQGSFRCFDCLESEPQCEWEAV